MSLLGCDHDGAPSLKGRGAVHHEVESNPRAANPCTVSASCSAALLESASAPTTT